MGKIYMIGAMKGGVGKSVSVFNLAYSLQKRGKRVLAVDFDPQANLTTCFGAEDVDVAVGDLMMAVIEDEELPEREEYIWERNGVDFIPSSIQLSAVEAKLRLEMRSELKRLHVDTDSTFVYVTHDQLEAMALATKICLMNKAVLQQYDPPLVVYNKPVNLFVADFVGNPTMNFINATGERKGINDVFVHMLGKDLVFHSSETIDGDVSDLIIGIRPEFVKLGEGNFNGVVYTTLPSGMETTVKVKHGEDMVTSVVFGSVDFSHSLDMPFSIVSDNIIMFEKASGKRIAIGSLS